MLQDSRLLQVSLLLHVLAVLAWIWRPGWWPWIVGAVFVDHLTIMAASLWPRSGLLGPNLTRLPRADSGESRVALTFDDGPDPDVTPRVLEMLRQYGAKATFFCIGFKAERHPELVRAIVEQGHSVENHSYRHSSLFCFLGPVSMGREIDRAQAVLSAGAGWTPRYFRAPAGLRNPWLHGVLAAREMRLVSWTRRAFDTVTRDPARVVNRLTRDLADGDVILLHDGSSARDAEGRPLVLLALQQLLDQLKRCGLLALPLPRP
jgi:peptidoglycan/xylan/chitin deacetylase (PgdA/CDA1 family)